MSKHLILLQILFNYFIKSSQKQYFICFGLKHGVFEWNDLRYMDTDWNQCIFFKDKVETLKQKTKNDVKLRVKVSIRVSINVWISNSLVLGLWLLLGKLIKNNYLNNLSCIFLHWGPIFILQEKHFLNNLNS